MLLRVLLSEGDFFEKILYVLIGIIALLPALTVHEWAHGFAAYKLGDRTAKADGRLSLNPLDHIDPAGALAMLLVGFGWAKPVPVMTRNFKKPRRDFAIVSLAGPIANIILGLISSLLFVLSVYISIEFEFLGTVTADMITQLFLYSAAMNIGLAVFNLIPIPPLDGSNVLMCILPNHLAAKYSKIRHYTHYILLGIILLSWMPEPFDRIYEIIFMPVTWVKDNLLELFSELGLAIFNPIFSEIKFWVEYVVRILLFSISG